MKVLNAIVLTGLLSLGACAQEGTVEFFGTLGYGFPVGGRLLATSEREPTAGPSEEDDHFINMGRGLKLEGGAGIRVYETTTWQASLEYSAGLPRIVEEDLDGGTLTEVTYKFSTLGLKTMIMPRFEFLGLLDMYTGVGLGVFWGFFSLDATQSNPAASAKGNQDLTASLGFLGAFGGEVPLSDQLQLVGELGLEAMSFQVKERVIEESTFDNGPFEISDDSEIFEDDVPDREPRDRYPGTNVSFRLGVRYLLY
jgi:hypothetical protein